MRKTRSMHAALPWHGLALAIAGVLAGPVVAQSAGQQVADGTTLDVTTGEYETHQIGEHALYARHGGLLRVADDVFVNTLGTSASGVRVETGGSIVMNGGSIVTNASIADGVFVGGDSSATFGRDTQGFGTLIRTSDVDAAAVRAEGRGARASLTGAALVTQHGVGAFAESGGSITFTGGRINTAGDSAYGALARNDNSSLHITDTQIVTIGREAHGVTTLGAQTNLALSNTRIQTAGQFAYGVNLNQVDRASFDRVAIRTSGAGAAALWAPLAANEVKASNIDFQTTGRSAPGIETLDARVEVDTGNVTTHGAASHALHASNTNAARIDATRLNIRTFGVDAIAAFAAGSASIQLAGSQIETTGERAFGLAAIGDGGVDATDTTVVASGVDASAVAVGGGHVTINGGALRSTQASALYAADGSIQLNGVNQVIGGNGDLLLVEAGDKKAVVDLALSQSHAEGDIVRAPESPTGSPIQVALRDVSTWTGATDVVTDMTVAGGSTWTLTRSSTVGALDLDGGTIDYGTHDAGNHTTLTVAGDVTGTGGVVRMHTLLNEGGTLDRQQTDRLLVYGDIRTTASTLLDIVPTSQADGQLTDHNRNGALDADEGISVVQVAGQSRADAFALRGGYVAAGPYQYTLHAFGPGQADPDQNALGSELLQWDYRLGNTYVEDRLDPQELIQPEPIQRVKVVPQLPSYLSAPTALFNYGSQIVSTLHERLGEIRQVASRPEGQGGELFARYINSQQRYGSSRHFTDFGYNFDQQVNALQLGGSLIAWTGNHSALRAGWALDKGSTRVTPHAVDGASFARYRAYGSHAWLTWLQDGGFYVDAVVGGERFHGDVATAARGGNVARLRARNSTFSVETGYPFAIGNGWELEPQAQWSIQRLSFNAFEDNDGLAITLRPSTQTVARAGARLVKTDISRVTPYLRADVLRTIGGASRIDTYSAAWNMGDAFAAGRVGTSYRLGAGATAALTPNLSAFGQADYRHGTAGHGFAGWAGSIGLRLNF
ncbi:autotransporter outer membrane beta-barrel domain-containing protein [Dyella sp. GSA-30]|uniref:autotransporter family protein n=1 Tax=Dyella sp. GSA-30 TaxID=2994496 RepID=UPI002490B690|nr:autotransporter outer membrane beta-barrel domain-containing protein [Dyella sp. GSA-30]BDU19905.1 autotransporter [Dyella sp. GSA-30]